MQLFVHPAILWSIGDEEIDVFVHSFTGNERVTRGYSFGWISGVGVWIEPDFVDLKTSKTQVITVVLTSDGYIGKSNMCHLCAASSQVITSLLFPKLWLYQL